MADSKPNLSQRLLSVQATLRSPTGEVPNGSCEELLEAVKPLLHTAGLLLELNDSIESVDGRHYLKALASVTVAEGGSDCVWSTGYVDGAFGPAASACARKRALLGLFLMDDDARAASEAAKRSSAGVGDRRAPSDKKTPQGGARKPHADRFERIRALKEEALGLGIKESAIKEHLDATYKKPMGEYGLPEIKGAETYLEGLIADMKALKEGAR